MGNLRLGGFSNLFYAFLYLLMGFICTTKPLQGQPNTDNRISLTQIRVDANGDDTLDYLGQDITVAGFANIESGLLNGDVLQAYIQDDNIGVSISGDEISTPFKPGDSLIVNGKVQQYLGIVDINVESYEVIPNASKQVQAKPLMGVIEEPAAYVGMLVEGVGKIVEKGLTFHGKYIKISPPKAVQAEVMIYVTNFHTRYEDFNFDVLSIGDRIRVTGVVGEYNSEFPEDETYKVFLRTPDDLQYIGLPRIYLLVIMGTLIFIALLALGLVWVLRQKVNQKTEEIKKSLAEKDVLLREIHHRVKNSLSIVSGLIGLQMESTESSEAREVLQDSQNRIQSMALIHEKLYSTDSLSEIKVHTYLKELVESIHSTFTDSNNAVELKYDLEAIRIDLEKAIPCGLLINELVVNAFKHAFNDGEQGLLEVSLKRSKGKIRLTVADNGPGVPEDFSLDNTSSLGAMLIQTFAAQLEADIEISNRKKGAAFSFVFSENSS